MADEHPEEQATSGEIQGQREVPPEVRTILAMDGDAGGSPRNAGYTGDMEGGGREPPARRPKTEDNEGGGKWNGRFAVEMLYPLPTALVSVILPFRAWQRAHRDLYGQLTEDVQFSIMMNQVFWRDFLAFLRQGKTDEYDSFGLSADFVREHMAQAEGLGDEAEPDPEKVAQAVADYRDSLVDTALEMAGRGVSLKQFADLMSTGRGSA